MPTWTSISPTAVSWSGTSSTSVSWFDALHPNALRLSGDANPGDDAGDDYLKPSGDADTTTEDLLEISGDERYG